MNSSISSPNKIGQERVHYFSRQMLAVEDMADEQEYFRQKLRRHNRHLHGWGVVCGCEVLAAPNSAHPWRVQVCPGYIVAPQGDEIEITKPAYFDLARIVPEVFDPCSNVTASEHLDSNAPIHLAICYSECSTRPVRIHPAGCACDEAGCEFTRIRDDFVLDVLSDIPSSHTGALQADAAWRETIQNWVKNRSEPMPVPPCPECPDECWVVLASITLPADKQAQIDFGGSGNADRSYQWRRALYSTTAIHQMMLAFS